MDNQNMLSIRKVKLHGMTSTRWTTKDKITQYKGLINLYTRDRKIIDGDTQLACRKQYRELRSLQNNVVNDRASLDNAIHGDRQQLRNTLADHREMQLAYQDSHPKKAIENIEHVNFRRRKELDRLMHTMKIQSNVLSELKLERAEMEDRIKYEVHDLLPVEKEAQIVAGKVQDALLRKEAALQVKQTYAQLIAIMKKDALYFDAILNTVANDGTAQNKCLLNATKLGQLATEYLDDRRREYYELEKAVIRDMQQRKIDLSLIKDAVDNAANNIKHLIRRDSDLNTCIVQIDENDGLDELQKDVEKIEKDLQYLKDATAVSSFEKIYPCLCEQLNQKVRLSEFVRRGELQKRSLNTKVQHAELMKNTLHNTMVETTLDYTESKKSIKTKILEERTRILELEDRIRYRIDLKAQVRIYLRQLQQLCRPIKADNAPAPESPPFKMRSKLLGEPEGPQPPQPDTIEGQKICAELLVKCQHLVGFILADVDRTKIDQAYMFFEILMRERCNVKSDKHALEEGLLEGLSLEVVHVPTRDDIKRDSRQIVDAHAKADNFFG